MVKFYVRRILVDKKMTIDDVPEAGANRCGQK